MTSGFNSTDSKQISATTMSTACSSAAATTATVVDHTARDTKDKPAPSITSVVVDPLVRDRAATGDMLALVNRGTPLLGGDSTTRRAIVIELPTELDAAQKLRLAAIEKHYSTISSAADSKASDLRTWHLPPNNDDYFVGREKELAKLSQSFDVKQGSAQTNKPVIFSAVSGLGGVGKTQLAIRYCHHPKKQYTFTVWFQAETENMLLNEYAKLAEELRLPLKEKPTKFDFIRVVHQYLSQHSPWLVIYDNAGVYNDIKEFLPTNSGDVIITTRRQEWHDKGTAIEVDVFTEAEAITYLKRLIQRDAKENFKEVEAKALKELAKELGCLPLALAQAGAYMKKRNKTVADYLRLYRVRSAEMLADKTLPVDSNTQPVATTWNISLQAIQEDEQKAGDNPVLLGGF